MKLQTLHINYTTQNEAFSGKIPIGFEVFGPRLGEAPIVLVNHALTGMQLIICKLKRYMLLLAVR